MVIVPSTLDAVTVYAEGALCTRLVSVTPVEGRLPTRLRINGLPLSLRANSLRATVRTGPPGLAVRDLRPVFDVRLPPEEDVPAARRALEEAQEALARLEAELARTERDIQAVQGLRPAFPPRSKENPQPRDTALPGILALASFVDAELAALHSRKLELERKLRDARAEVELRHRRLVEGSSAQRGQRAQLFRAAVLTLSEVESAGDTGVQLALEYAVDGARWVPGYDLRLPRTLDGGTLTMRGFILQRTGEDWRDVRLSLSTANLDRRADVPELKALRIGRKQPAPQRSGWREPPPGLDELFSGYDAATGSRTPATPVEPLQEKPPRLDAAPAEPTALPRVELAPPLPSPSPEPKPVLRAPPPPAPALAAPMASLGGGGAPPPPGAKPTLMPSADAEQVRRGSANRLRSSGPSRKESRYDFDADMGAEEEAGPSLAASEPFAEPAPSEASSELELAGDLLDYGGLELGPANVPDKRGRLRPRSPESAEELLALAAVSVRIDVVALVAQRRREASSVQQVAPPAWSMPPRESAAHFDFRHDVERRADVPSDGAWHMVPVFSAPVGLTSEYLCVPSMEPRAFRTVKLENRTPYPLLAGPVDVTLGDEFLMTSPLPTLAPGAVQRLGLGVEESIKVSRNTRFEEASGGVFGGASVLTHHVSVEVANRLGQRVTVELRERVPVPAASEKDIKVEETEVKPAWSKPEPLPGEPPVEGERAWRVTLQPGETQTLSATYVVRIPSSKLLQGGNRRT